MALVCPVRRFAQRLLIVAVILGGSPVVHAVQPPSFTTPWDTIPNFARAPTIVSSRAGAWSDQFTWSPTRLPNANDIVLITHDVTYDSLAGIADVIGVDAGGRLRFTTSQSTLLRVATLLVMPGGMLEVGTETNPIGAARQRRSSSVTARPTRQTTASACTTPASTALACSR